MPQNPRFHRPAGLAVRTVKRIYVRRHYGELSCMAHATPNVTFEELDPLDARSAVETASAIRSRTSVYLHVDEFHFQTFLDWALQDVTDARSFTAEAASVLYLRFAC
jgi:hypothetical protein